MTCYSFHNKSCHVIYSEDEDKNENRELLYNDDRLKSNLYDDDERRWKKDDNTKINGFDNLNNNNNNNDDHK